MEKITEKLLLEKGSPKTNKLEQLKTLNLSKLGLKLQDLPVGLLSRLRALERWDLSGNRLQELPRSLELPALRCLDLSDNQMEDVTSLEALCSLEELKMEDNLYITVSDNHKLMVLLPNLRMYNGKDISPNANHLRFVYTENLRTRIAAVWEKSFRLPDSVTPQKMAALRSDFVTAARQQIKYGPSSVADFTKWRVGILAEEFFCSLTEPKEEPENREEPDTAERCAVSTPTKRKQPASDSGANTTPRKKLCAGVPASPAAESPRKSSLRLRPQTPAQNSGARMSPRKTAQPPPTPTRGQAKAETPGRVQQKGGGAEKEGVGRKEQRRDAGLLLATKTQPVHLKPLHVLQCHSKQDSPEDFSTQLWACAFQPQPDSSGAAAGSRLVATCGGDSVCVVDCETGMVMKKYKASGEEFFSLAWSTVLMTRGGGAPAQPCSILAAGGKRGVVKLIHPRNNVAYGEFRASRKALSVLRFNHRQGNFLFTGSYDKKIQMWDVGGVDAHYSYKVVQLLLLETSTTPLHICLPPASPGSHLLTACEDGLHCYNTQLSAKNTAKRQKEFEVTFPVYNQEDKDHDFHTVDGLSFLSDDVVASKNFLHGSIYLWSWSRTRAQRPGRKNLAVCAVVLAELQWAKTEIPYLSLNTCPGHAYIVLEWPAPVRRGLGPMEGPSINSVAMDPELRYLVALSDKNMVVVWKRAEAS